MAVHLDHVPRYARTPLDEEFYRERLRPRLPDAIFDVHVHINLPEHVLQVPPERIQSDWALQCGAVLTCEDAYRIAEDMFPGIRYSIAGFPWPVREADLASNNDYLAQMRRIGWLSPFMVVKPEWDPEEVEATLLEGGFVGFKPYPDMVSGQKGADISILDFIPHSQWALLEKHGKAVVLHLPRAERLASRANASELLEIRQRYPGVGIIIAHFGRSFCPDFMRGGLAAMGRHVAEFHYDLSGVMHAESLRLAFEAIPAERILYGSDLPIFHWHGDTECTPKGYLHLSRESYPWVKEHRPAERESRYVLFLYRQIAAVLDTLEHRGATRDQIRGVFGENARTLLGLTRS
jgi:predicted TIM-barrel fold metal-dependent hydrolase